MIFSVVWKIVCWCVYTHTHSFYGAATVYELKKISQARDWLGLLQQRPLSFPCEVLLAYQNTVKLLLMIPGRKQMGTIKIYQFSFING